MKVREFMTTVAHTCRPEDTLDKAAHLLWAHDCGSLPVIAADGRVLAMITDRDVCMGAFLRGQALSGIACAACPSSTRRAGSRASCRSTIWPAGPSTPRATRH
jgi:CBS-domain-containing membrane protein